MAWRLSRIWAGRREIRVNSPGHARCAALLVYLAMPLDVIPDFIPILGHLDDRALPWVVGAVLTAAVGALLYHEPHHHSH